MEKTSINGKVFNLVKTKLCRSDCGECVFGNRGRCKLMRHTTDMSDEEENDFYYICEINPNMHWEADNKEEDASHISSTGGESQNDNNASRVTKADTKRSITLELTLKEAREYYNSHNPILKDLACRAYTPAELEDVRRCTMNIDIKTAKRLYHNAENAVRDFVLSAFSKEELED